MVFTYKIQIYGVKKITFGVCSRKSVLFVNKQNLVAAVNAVILG